MEKRLSFYCWDGYHIYNDEKMSEMISFLLLRTKFRVIMKKSW